MSDLIPEQPPPRPTAGDVWRDVIADMEARRRHGIAKYDTPVQPGNGRDALRDAYEEALDLCVYLRQAITERGRISERILGVLNDAFSGGEDAGRYRANHHREWLLDLHRRLAEAAIGPMTPADAAVVALPNHGPCAECGQDVRHAYPWWTGPDPARGARPMHEECARRRLFTQ